MFTKIGLPILAVLLLGFAGKHVLDSQKPIPKLPPPIEPTRNPFPNCVAGGGMVEPETENISIGSPVPGVVVEVHVKVGQNVAAGDPLFRLDDRPLRAELQVREAMLADARAALAKLESMPRPEEIPAAEARVREAESDYQNLKEQQVRGEKLFAKNAISEEELTNRKMQAAQARERHERAAADLRLLQAGAWEPDKLIARAAMRRIEAMIKQTETDLDRLVVRALVDGEVLQVNVRPGEFVGAPAGQTQIVLGNVRQMHVRVDVDEYDIPRFQPTAAARATLKGQPDKLFPLKFVRIEPYVVPKKSLTGDNTERVDTRVLQVIYAIEAAGQRMFVGQQLDVFIDASK